MFRLAVLLSATLVAFGLVTPAFAQSALNGDWQGLFHEDQPERGPGPELGDYLGIPINEAGRQYADSWDASRLTLPEHQCRAHVSPYIYRGPIRVQITEEIDPGTQTVIAIRHFLSTYAQERTIWLDGRPHPPEDAPHTWMGFSTGEWQGDVLKVETTHIKQGWHRRNGIPMSAQATMTEYFFRHGNVLTQLTHHRGSRSSSSEPLVKTTNLLLDANSQPPISTRRGCSARPTTKCRDAIPPTCRTTCPARTRISPSSPPSTGCRSAPTRGGAETMYPEYMEKVKTMPIGRGAARKSQPVSRMHARRLRVLAVGSRGGAGRVRALAGRRCAGRSGAGSPGRPGRPRRRAAPRRLCAPCTCRATCTSSSVPVPTSPCSSAISD